MLEVQDNPDSPAIGPRVANLENTYKLVFGIIVGVIVVLFTAYIALVMGYVAYMKENEKDYGKDFQELKQRASNNEARMSEYNAKLEEIRSSIDKFDRSIFYYRAQ